MEDCLDVANHDDNDDSCDERDDSRNEGGILVQPESDEDGHEESRHNTAGEGHATTGLARSVS
ncbi:MAG: hypothetical protein R3A49_08390 [Acidimicrobiia bacterium]